MSIDATLIDGYVAKGCPSIDAPAKAPTIEVSTQANQPTSGSMKLGDGIYLTAERIARKMGSPKSK